MFFCHNATAANSPDFLARSVHKPCPRVLFQVSVVSFDKTGTLTKGSFQVVACQVSTLAGCVVLCNMLCDMFALCLPCFLSQRLCPISSSFKLHVWHCRLLSLQARDGWSVQQMLRLLGSLERGSSHPLAAAVLGYAASQGAVCDAPVEGLEVVQGAGLVATVDGRRVVAGTAGLMELRANLAGPEIAAAQHAIDAEGATACLVAVDGRFMGWLR